MLYNLPSQLSFQNELALFSFSGFDFFFLLFLFFVVTLHFTSIKVRNNSLIAAGLKIKYKTLNIDSSLRPSLEKKKSTGKMLMKSLFFPQCNIKIMVYVKVFQTRLVFLLFSCLSRYALEISLEQTSFVYFCLFYCL